MAIVKVTLTLPFGLGGVEWKPNNVQRRTAWNIYIELETRIATQDLSSGEGFDQDTLKSLYTLFTATRRILREAGPEAGLARDTVGGIAISVLNQGMRPFLAKWRKLLRSTSDASRNLENAAFRDDLKHLKAELGVYADVLATIAQSK